MRPPINTMSKEAYDAGLTALRTELTANHTSALASLRAEHDNALAAQRRELTSSATSTASPARAEIVASERTRIAGILDHAEAKGRSSLAHHLALKSDMSTADAVAMLAVSGREAAAAAKTHRLDAVVPIPRVGADGGDGAEPQNDRERGAQAFAAVRQAADARSREKA